LVNKNAAVYCLFMLVHIVQWLLLTNTTFDFNNVLILVNVEININ